mgnify:CR=1 FL=1
MPEIVQTCPEMSVYAFSGPTGLHTGRGVPDVPNQKLIILCTYNRFPEGKVQTSDLLSFAKIPYGLMLHAVKLCFVFDFDH